MTQATRQLSLNEVGAVMTKVVKHVENQAGRVESAISAGEHARRRMPLPEEYGSERNAGDLPKLFPHMKRLFRGVFSTYWQYRVHRKPVRREVSAEFLSDLEAFARDCGATAIGYAPITPALIFKEFVIPHPHAIVILSEMRREPFGTAPSTEAMMEVAKAYADTTIIATQISGYLRRHGYSAFSGISMGGSVDHTRLAERAGLGKIGYHGSLISPQQGARVRINVVFTNIENLPYREESAHDWVLDFCDMCRKCIRKCPPQAIRYKPEPDADGRISVIDADKCGPYMSANHGCGLCIAVCPFSMAGYDKVQDGFERAQAQRERRAPLAAKG